MINTKDIEFNAWDTGGGCRALGAQVNDDGDHILVTDAGGCDIPNIETDTLLFGFYDDSGDEPPQMEIQEGREGLLRWLQEAGYKDAATSTDSILRVVAHMWFQSL